MKRLLYILLILPLMASAQVALPTMQATFTPHASTGVSYMLDTYTGYDDAWDLRQVVAAATKAVRVRRTTDNAEQDIGFDTFGNFDTVSFKTFIGAGDGYAAKIYSQKAGGYDAVQTNAIYQFQIVLHNPLTSRPAFYNDGTKFMTTGRVEDNSSVSVFAIFKGDAGAGNNLAVVGSAEGAGADYNYFELGNFDFWFFGDGSSYAYIGIGATTGRLAAIARSATDRELFVNGTSVGTSATSKQTNFTFRIGGQYVDLQGYFTEIIVYPSGVSSTYISGINSNQAAYY